MEVIDVTVPPDAKLPLNPGNTPIRLEPIRRIPSRDDSKVTRQHVSIRAGSPADARGAAQDIAWHGKVLDVFPCPMEEFREAVAPAHHRAPAETQA